jgi:imidazolonepropionase-like amidohydrolase
MLMCQEVGRQTPIHSTRYQGTVRNRGAGPGRRAGLVATCHNAVVGFDLVIRGATVVTPGHREAADIGVAHGRIAQLGGAMTGAEELTADGLLAIPGGVDAHTHLVHQGLIAQGRGAVANFPDARPVAAEVAAVDQAIGIARRTGEWLRRTTTAGMLPSRPRRRL